MQRSLRNLDNCFTMRFKGCLSFNLNLEVSTLGDVDDDLRNTSLAHNAFRAAARQNGERDSSLFFV